MESILAAIDSRIEALQHAKSLLTGETIKRGPGRPKRAAVSTAPKKKRGMSAAARARIGAAQKARWAKLRAQKK